MKKIFITYGDDAFKKSRKRLAIEAKDLGIFDEIIIYTPKDLPLHIKSSPLMAYARGGGYWCWKPYIIWHTLQKYGDDAIVFYVDAGCTLRDSIRWQQYIDEIEKEDCESIVFQYDKDRYGYPCNGKIYPYTMRHWTKLEVINAYKNRFSNDDWLNYGKIMAAFIIARNKKNSLISKWYYTSLLHPEYFADSLGGEINHTDFVEHRHDQQILGILAYSDRSGVQILEEEIDSPREHAAVLGWRLKDDKFKMSSFLKTRYIKKIKGFLGERAYDILHFWK